MNLCPAKFSTCLSCFSWDPLPAHPVFLLCCPVLESGAPQASSAALPSHPHPSPVCQALLPPSFALLDCTAPRSLVPRCFFSIPGGPEPYLIVDNNYRCLFPSYSICYHKWAGESKSVKPFVALTASQGQIGCVLLERNEPRVRL